MEDHIRRGAGRQGPSLREQFTQAMAGGDRGNQDHGDRRHVGRGPSRSILEMALEYHRRGWSIIPIRTGSKKPACRSWKPYQKTRSDESKVRKWFANDNGRGVAVVLGNVSGGMVCRDFDTMEGYDRWAADHPDLARTLPTAATAHGRHVYFRSNHQNIKKLEDGELRGAGYCLLPPSRHPDGPAYHWLIPLPDGSLPMVEDVRAAGFLGACNVTERTERTECTERTETTEDYSGEQKQLNGRFGQKCDPVWVACLPDAKKIRSKLWPNRKRPLRQQDRILILKACYLSRTRMSANWLWDSVEGVRIKGPSNPAAYLVECLKDHHALSGQDFAMLLQNVIIPVELLGDSRPNEKANDQLPITTTSLDAVVEAAILESLPSGVGKRNRQVFELARALKAIPTLADAPVDMLESHVRCWHTLGVQKGVIRTEPFEETWIDFITAWPKVKFPKGGEPMTKLFEVAKQSPTPQAALRYEQGGLRLLVALCRELQRVSGDKPFFLGCRTAGSLLGVKHVTAWRWLILLAHDKIVEEVEKGDRAHRRASRFRYLGD